jgi:hypothetical protein
MTPTRNNGIIDRPSNHSVEQTVDKLKNILQAKGVTLFALIDHSGEAERVGMKMPPTKLLIFGNPRAGTPLMWRRPAPPLTFRSRFWSRKMLRERSGFLTTARHTCRSATAFRLTCRKTSRWPKHWPRRLRNDEAGGINLADPCHCLPD